MSEEEFNGCGCCGREIAPGADWCRDCESHLLPLFDGGRRRFPYERTYHAQHKRKCPYVFRP